MNRRDQIATVLMEHRRLDCPYGDTPLCSCGMLPDQNDAKVYDWQHRLHVAEMIIASAKERQKE